MHDIGTASPMARKRRRYSKWQVPLSPCAATTCTWNSPSDAAMSALGFMMTGAGRSDDEAFILGCSPVHASAAVQAIGHLPEKLDTDSKLWTNTYI